MKKYKEENLEYVETLLFDDKVVNVFLDDAGQCYLLQYYEPETQEMVITSCGAYVTDYIDCAEMLFEDPKNCNHYKDCEEKSGIELFTCNEFDKSYCTNCKFCFLVQERDKRIQ